MITLSQALLDKFSTLLSESIIPKNEHSTFRKWLRYYLDFCHKSQFQNYWLPFVKILFFTRQNHFDASDAVFS